MKAEMSTQEKLTHLHTLRPAAEYHEDMGDVIWWHLPVQEYPAIGGGPGAGTQDRFGDPTDVQRMHDDGWYTHFSPLPKCEDMITSDGALVTE